MCDNAIAYNKTGGSVKVSIYKEKEKTVLSVSDTGVGIAPEHQERIFERFYRVDPARSRATGGTGLGLSIVKHVATNHGGDVLVWSVEEAGSTFTIRFPITSQLTAVEAE